MAEANRYEFSYDEVATALIKQQGLHEGIWAVTMKFGIGATMGGPSKEEAVPTAMVPVLNIGLAKVEKEGRTAVDAAKVNPAKAQKTQAKSTGMIHASTRK